MKSFFNRHIKKEQINVIDDNCFALEDTTDMTGFGFRPQFQMSPEYVIAIQYTPKDGLLSLLLSQFEFFRPKNTRQIHVLQYGEEWQCLVPWRYKLCWHIKGCRILLNRLDQFTISHYQNTGGVKNTYDYDVTIHSHVDPNLFFDYLSSQERDSQQESIVTEIENRIQNWISKQFYEFGDNANINREATFASQVLERVGYYVDDCYVQYVHD